MSDVLTLLKNDHQAVERLLGRFDDLPIASRDEYLCEVVHTLVGHEVAEERVVYPAIREEGLAGNEVADARLAEQAEAEQLLADMESQESASGAFTAKFKKLARFGTRPRSSGGVHRVPPARDGNHGRRAQGARDPLRKGEGQRTNPSAPPRARYSSRKQAPRADRGNPRSRSRRRPQRVMEMRAPG